MTDREKKLTEFMDQKHQMQRLLVEAFSIGHDSESMQVPRPGWEAIEQKCSEILISIVEQMGEGAVKIKKDQFAKGIDGPEVTQQMLHDCGLNPFAFQLLVESYAKLTKKIPFTVRFKSCIFHMRPVE